MWVPTKLAAPRRRPECPMFMLFCLTTSREQTLHSKVLVFMSSKQMLNNVLVRIIRKSSFVKFERKGVAKVGGR